MAKTLSSDTARSGSNQLTAEQRDALEQEACSRLAALDAERKEFGAKQTRARKEIMGGIVKGQLLMTSRDFLAFVYEEFKLSQDDDNEEALRMHQLAKARAWQRIPVGTQKSLFEELKLGDQAENLKGGAGAAPANAAKAAKAPKGPKGARGSRAPIPAPEQTFEEDEERDTGARLN